MVVVGRPMYVGLCNTYHAVVTEILYLMYHHSDYAAASSAATAANTMKAIIKWMFTEN